MTFTEITVIDKIEIVESGHVQVRRERRVLDGERKVYGEFHRAVHAPGEVLPDDVLGRLLAVLESHRQAVVKAVGL